MSESELILNPKTNRYIKKSSQTGKRLLKELATRIFEGTSKNQPDNAISDIKPTVITEPANLILAEQPIQPIQTALLETGVAIVEQNISKFKGLNEVNMDALFKKLLLERLSIPSAKKKKKMPKKKKKERFRVAQSSSDSSDSETS